MFLKTCTTTLLLKPPKIRPSHLNGSDTFLKQQNVQVRTTMTDEKDASASNKLGGQGIFAQRVFEESKFYQSHKNVLGDHLGLPNVNDKPWTPAIHYYKFSRTRHLYLIFMPGLAPVDVNLKLEKGKFLINGHRIGKNWVEDCIVHYVGSIDLPENLPEKPEIVVRMKRGVLKILIEDPEVAKKEKVEHEDGLKVYDLRAVFF